MLDGCVQAAATAATFSRHIFAGASFRKMPIAVATDAFSRWRYYRHVFIGSLMPLHVARLDISATAARCFILFLPELRAAFDTALVIACSVFAVILIYMTSYVDVRLPTSARPTFFTMA